MQVLEGIGGEAGDNVAYSMVKNVSYFIDFLFLHPHIKRHGARMAFSLQ